MDWTDYASPESGARISYPSSWAADADAHTDLLYPHQSFVVRSAAPPIGSAGEFPDLSSYPRSGVYMWLLHYSDLQNNRDCPPFQSFESYYELEQRVSEFDAFNRYGASFSGSQRSFLLRLWIGGSVSQDDISLMNHCLSSLGVP